MLQGLEIERCQWGDLNREPTVISSPPSGRDGGRVGRGDNWERMVAQGQEGNVIAAEAAARSYPPSHASSRPYMGLISSVPTDELAQIWQEATGHPWRLLGPDMGKRTSVPLIMRQPLVASLALQKW